MMSDKVVIDGISWWSIFDILLVIAIIYFIYGILKLTGVLI